jgi:predicted tellurium resistance membrane protein TerC
MDWLTDPQAWIGLAMLVTLEIVLGIDNIVFISILSSKLPAPEQPRARRLGLIAAMLMRILLLFSLAWIARLTEPLFAVLGHPVSGRDLVLLLGGLFLIAKSVLEIHDKLEGPEGDEEPRTEPSFTGVIVQIMLLDIVFSLDSVITAVGMVDELQVMVLAIVVAVGVMMAFAETVSAFIERHPTVKMLALSFLLLIGLTLLVEGLGHHVPKGYVYFAMGFAIFVEFLNLRVRSSGKPPVVLHQPYSEGSANE